jgi:outer membrane protein assembly factor BamB
VRAAADWCAPRGGDHHALRGGPAHGISPTISQPPRRGVDATPAIAADGTIYFGSNAGTLYALQPDGQLKWSAPGRGGFLASAAIGADGVVYTASGSSVVAYGPGDATHAAGAVLWEYGTGGLIESSLAIGPGSTLYAASRDDKLYASGP